MRLFEAWLEQDLGTSSSVRVGLYDLNSEFYTNDSAGYLLAPAFGIGSEIAATGPNGPSIFPSTALGVRFDSRFSDGLFVRSAFVNAHSGVLGDPGGVDTSFDDGGLVIAEAGVEAGRKLAVGVWRYTQRQDDIREIDTFGAPVQRIAQGVYLVFEHPLMGSADAWSSSAFFRAGLSEGQTTAFSGGWQAGLLVKRPFAGRADGVLSLGVNQGVLSDGYKRNQADLGLSLTTAETQIELTYSDKLLPNLTIQPDLQWIRRPGADRNVDDAVVAGLRVLLDM